MPRKHAICPLTLTAQAMRALHDAVAKVVEDHRCRGRPLAVWRDGKAVWLPVVAAGVVHESPAPYLTKYHGARR